MKQTLERPTPDALTVDEAAQYANVNVRTFRRLIADGRIPTINQPNPLLMRPRMHWISKAALDQVIAEASAAKSDD